MNNNLYCWNQPIVRGNYDFYLDGIIKAKNFNGEINATNVMLTEGSGTSSDDTTVINLSEKIKQIDTKLQEHFKFEDVKLNDGQKLEEVVTNPTTNKIYVVLSSNEENENDNYNEYVYRDGQFELIGSGSYAQLKAVDNNLKDLIDSNTTSIKNHETNKILHITNQERTTWNSKQNKLSFDTEPTKNSTNPCTSGGIYEAVKLRPIIPVGEKHTNSGFEIAVGKNSHAYNDYAVAVGNGAVATKRGELCLCASTEDGSIVSKIELKLIPSYEMFDDVMSGGYSGGNYVSERPYLEIKVSTGAPYNDPQDESNESYWEAVKIPIKNLFDLLLSNGGTITRSDNFGTTVETE